MAGKFNLRTDFGKRLRFVREQRQLSQTDLAKRAEFEPSAIAHFEAGRRLPGAESLRSLCLALTVSADFLIGISERATP